MADEIPLSETVRDDVLVLHEDIHHIVDLLNQAVSENAELRIKLAELVASHNQVGENVAWLVANTQGIFQMLNSPEMMQQMMSTAFGGGPSGGRLSPDAGGS